MVSKLMSLLLNWDVRIVCMNLFLCQSCLHLLCNCLHCVGGIEFLLMCSRSNPRLLIDNFLFLCSGLLGCGCFFLSSLLLLGGLLFGSLLFSGGLFFSSLLGSCNAVLLGLFLFCHRLLICDAKCCACMLHQIFDAVLVRICSIHLRFHGLHLVFHFCRSFGSLLFSICLLLLFSCLLCSCLLLCSRLFLCSFLFCCSLLCLSFLFSRSLLLCSLLFSCLL